MQQAATNYARAQADAYDNIAATPLQGQQAWQYASTDNFFSPEEASAALRKQLEPYRSQIEAKLTQIGYSPENLAKYPQLQADLYDGRRTELLNIRIASDVVMNGRLQIVPGSNGVDIRFTPTQPLLTIPSEIQGITLSRSERQQLAEEGSLPRPLLLPEKGEFIPTYIRIDPLTNTVELWPVKAEQMPTKLLGIDLTKEQQLQLVSGHAVRLSGLLDRQGEPFNATVNISPARQTLEFTDLSRLDVSLKPDNEFRQQVRQNNDGAKTDLTRSRETAVGSPTVTNQQSEAIREVMEKDPADQDRSIKVRR